MNIQLKKINKKNFDMVNNLYITEEQKQKRFVSNPYYAIAKSKFFRELKTFAIYLEKVVIGFVAFGLRPDIPLYWYIANGLEQSINPFWIDEVIIDKNYQNKGYGKIALEQLMKILKEELGCERVYGGYKSNNIASIKLCKSLGFMETDINTEGHIVIYKDL